MGHSNPPDPGAPATVSVTGPGGEPVVQYHFPVEVEVRTPAPVDVDAIVHEVLYRLGTCVSTQTSGR